MKTVLHDKHISLGAKMVEFGGWDMPLHYPSGVLHEHRTVRENVGIFDVSHMGRILIEGEDATKFLDWISTNRIEGKSEFSATYTVWCRQTGGCVDDGIIYKYNDYSYFVVVNASNREKDLAHFLHEAERFDVIIGDRYQEDGILAIQGPRALDVVKPLFPEVTYLEHMQFVEVFYQGEKFVLSSTGYTGAGGFEIYAPNHIVVSLWERFLDDGKIYGIEPIGLGARDTLRLEKGYALYGHEISENIAPNESVAHWTVKWKKTNFLGREALEKLEMGPEKRHEFGVILTEPGIAREGYPVWKDGKQIGHVTSGTFSPTLNKSIAIILVKGLLEMNDIVEIEIRQSKAKAKVTELPFV